MNSEEIKVTMGMDVGPLALGLRKGEQLVHAFENSFAGKVFEHVFPLASIAGAVVTLEKAIAKARDIQRQADEFGISTAFVQDLNNIGMLSGLSEQKIEKMMGAFMKSLPVGSDVEDEFFRIADKIAGIEDPVTRAQMAMESFGKSGYKLLPILEKGSAGIKELGAQFSKFSDEDIKNLEEAELGLKKFENFITIWTGRIAIGVEHFADVLKRMLNLRSAAALLMNPGALIGEGFDRLMEAVGEDVNSSAKSKQSESDRKLAQMNADKDAEKKRVSDAYETIREKEKERDFKAASPEKQLAMLEDRKMYLGLMITDEESYLALQVEILKTEEKINDVKKKIAEEDKKKSQAIDREFEKINSASDKWLESKRQLEKAKHPEFTLEELAGSHAGYWDRSIMNRPVWRTPGANQANEIERLRNWAKQNAMSENPEDQALAKTQWDKAEQLFDDLKKRFPFLKDPQEELKEHAKKSADTLDEILRKANSEGLNTNPAMGK